MENIHEKSEILIDWSEILIDWAENQIELLNKLIVLTKSDKTKTEFTFASGKTINDVSLLKELTKDELLEIVVTKSIGNSLLRLYAEQRINQLDAGSDGENIYAVQRMLEHFAMTMCLDKQLLKGAINK